MVDFTKRITMEEIKKHEFFSDVKFSDVLF